MDLVLSSGYLAFARHIGVLQALRERAWRAQAIMGTSSGAIIGALHAAGMSPDAIAHFLTQQGPAAGFRWSRRPWRGLLSLGPMHEALSRVLPDTFEELKRPFAVGVTAAGGRHRLLSSGPLVSAVVASCAVPVLFNPIVIAGTRFVDGGASRRVGVDAWRRWRPGRDAVVHVVERSRGAVDDEDLSGLVVVRTPRAGASLRSWGDFEAQVRQAHGLATRQLPARLDDQSGEQTSTR